ncbi:MAG: transketolase [Pseudomonadota bacterium]|nr:transketolase [Pseudomonadota bacterium]
MPSSDVSSLSAAVPARTMANALRALAMDAVQAANSGHPGMPMGMADVATVLFTDFLKFDPTAPDWADRDRFILSAGHGSMLLYGLLHLTGYDDFPLDELKKFRQLGARTAGHPEYGVAGGIETTTGPLGQGLANAVGMAMAERTLAARWGDDLVDHRTYVIAGDGCLMEGISQEAISLAGHHKLSKLIVLFDDNGISIDGPVSLTTSDDQLARFAASGWACQAIDGHDQAAIADALRAAQNSDRPVLIACRTVIGYGAPNKAGGAGAHGAPLGDDEIAATRAALGWSHPPFDIPDDVRAAWTATGGRGQTARAAWQARVSAAPNGSEFTAALTCPTEAAVPAIAALKADLAEEPPKIASRVASQNAIEALVAAVPSLIVGSADLTGSNNTKVSAMTPITADQPDGNYLYYGVREHAMAAAMNGMALHGGVIPAGGTFLVFTDYCRPSIRLAALMGLGCIYVMTHDSIGLGEDGPTHQPVEHLAALRAIPNLNVYRPADAVETAECWAAAVTDRASPSVLALSRQGLPPQRTDSRADNPCLAGGYVLTPESAGPRQLTVVASGSEVALANDARTMLEAEGIATAVVSMPCLDRFLTMEAAYQDSVVPPGVALVVVEAGVRQCWDRLLGRDGAFVGMSGFGESAPAGDLFEHFGITADAVAAAARAQLAG